MNGRSALLLLGLGVLLAPAAHAFGPAAHRVTTARAIDTLPGPLKDFYKAHRLELPTLALEPEFAEEGPERRFAVDRAQPFPFLDVPRKEAAFRERFGDPPGRLPWLIEESYARLVEAFRAADKARILEESDKLAGFVTDLQNPLALSDNADGQKTAQHGLYARFSQKLPEAMDKRLKLDVEAARYLDEPAAYVFSIVAAAYIWHDNLLYADELARRGKSGYTEIYYEDLERRAGALLRERLSEAATDAGSYWYTAWVAAGKPALK